jgi:hypothetical protein
MENQLVSTQKKKLKRKAHDLKNQDAKLGSKSGSNSRIQFASNESKLVSKNLEPGHPSKVGSIIPTWVMNRDQPHMKYNLPCSTANMCGYVVVLKWTACTRVWCGTFKSKCACDFCVSPFLTWWVPYKFVWISEGSRSSIESWRFSTPLDCCTFMEVAQAMGTHRFREELLLLVCKSVG